MSQQDPPKIEFPCDYPIKVLGRHSDEFHAVIIAVFEQHAPGFDQETIKIKASSKGTFTSVPITITATGQQPREALHRELLATGVVQMVI